MNDILKVASILIGIGGVAVAASMILPVPDGGVFAYTILLSAIGFMLLVCRGLSTDRFTSTADIMAAIGDRRPLRLTITAYLLGCSTVACSTVLVYRVVTRL